MDTNYAEYLLAFHCMPTLMKVKPANLISVSMKRLQDNGDFNRILDEILAPFESSYFSLYEQEDTLLLMIYQPELLADTVTKLENMNFLKVYGYELCNFSVAVVLNHLRLRYQNYKERGQDFPHEIGIILGYPYPDVIDFIKYKGSNYITCDFWKVYHEEEKISHIFAQYRALRAYALRLLASGKSLADMKGLEEHEERKLLL